MRSRPACLPASFLFQTYAAASPPPIIRSSRTTTCCVCVFFCFDFFFSTRFTLICKQKRLRQCNVDQSERLRSFAAAKLHHSAPTAQAHALRTSKDPGSSTTTDHNNTRARATGCVITTRVYLATALIWLLGLWVDSLSFFRSVALTTILNARGLQGRKSACCAVVG